MNAAASAVRSARLQSLVLSLAGAALALGVASAAAGQELQFSPGLGLSFAHRRPLLDEPSTASGPGVRKHAVGRPVFTSRLEARLRPHFGVETSLSYSPAMIAITRPAGGTYRGVEDVDAGLVLASARTVLRLNPESMNVSAHLASGFGMVRRFGEAWSDTPARTTFAAVLGAGGRAPLRQLAGTAFRFELEDYISWPEFDMGNGRQSRPRLYHDLIFSLGLAIPLTGRGGGRAPAR